MILSIHSSLRLCCLVLANLALQSSASAAAEGADACPGETFVMRHTSGGAAPYIRLSVDGQAGNFLLDWGSTRSALSARHFAAPAGAPGIVSFTLPSFPTGVFALQPDAHLAAPRGGRLGIVGTDFLAKMSAFLSYGPVRDTVKLGPGPCDAAALEARGFVAVAQTSFSAAGGDGAAPNVPVVRISIAGVDAPAQLDSGYDDALLKHSIDINTAFEHRLRASGVRLRRVREVDVATCSGVEKRQVLSAPGVALQIGGAKANAIRSIRRYHLLLKPKNGCGGIADVSTPAAQLGASFLRTLSPLVIDGKAAKVWVKK